MAGDMAARLYTYENNFRAQKVLIAAQYSGFAVEVPEDFVFGESNKTDEFLQKFPNGKVPALQTADNRYIFESNAIAYYVGNKQLRGSSLVEQAEIMQWISFGDNEILTPAFMWLFPCMGMMQLNKQNTENSKQDIKRVLKILNDHLLTRTYLVGDRITQADISMCCNLLALYQQVLEPSFREPYQNVNRWFTTLINQPQFKKILGDVVLCEKMAQFDAKKFAEVQQSMKKDKEPKQKQEKPPSQKKEKKEQKPKVEEEVAEEPDETELALAQEPKSTSAADLLPKGTFKMDDFKRVYSNEEIDVSLKYFWENFDSENYSIWYCEYLFPKELTLVFMSCNLISGMFQRLDKMRKIAFGSAILFGEDNKSTISGIWVWRGHELAFKLSDDWQIDYESYSWKKLDPSTEETKTLVNEYLSWEGKFGGKTFNQGKIFK